MSESEFDRMKAAAVEQMRSMNARADGAGRENMPPVPPFVRIPHAPNQNAGQNHTPDKQPPPPQRPKSDPNRSGLRSLLGGLDLPFLDQLKTESDLSLILGLLLILVSEKADKKLLFALLYILL